MHSSFLQLGHLHISVYGIFAAIGLMSALALSQRTARYGGLAPEAVWNVGVTAILSAFVISRFLLIAFDFRSFLQYPLLVLALPSLTTTGILLTVLLMLGYIRWRKLPFLPLLDAFAPCAALLWAFLSLGSFIAGARDGMPTRLPWGVRDTALTAIHPVELYTFIAASMICIATLSLIRFSRRTGHTVALAFISSGVAVFFIDFLRLPSELFDRSPLEGSQIIGVVMILIGAALLLRTRTSINQESGTEPPHAI